MKKLLVPVALILVTFPTIDAWAEASSCQPSRIIRAVDELFRADGQVAQMEMRVVRPRSTRTLRMRFWFAAISSGLPAPSISWAQPPRRELAG